MKTQFKYGFTRNAENIRTSVRILVEGQEYDFDISNNSIMFERMGEGSVYNPPHEQLMFDTMNELLEGIVSKIAEKNDLDIVF